MTTDLLHRIRWANVARAAALLLAVLLAVAWPRLRGHAEALPPAVATPATAEEAATTPDTPPMEAPRPGPATARSRAPARAKARTARRPTKTHARRRKKPAASPPPVVSPTPVAATPVWPPPPRASPAAEFRP
jgi:hypothetical protein